MNGNNARFQWPPLLIDARQQGTTDGLFHRLVSLLQRARFSSACLASGLRFRARGILSEVRSLVGRIETRNEKSFLVDLGQFG